MENNEHFEILVIAGAGHSIRISTPDLWEEESQ
jgi:hypothetical protein